MYDPLQVNLPYFDGPLDLLLHLVRKQELDINELRLADLTEPYLAYLDQLQEVNLDQGGEFLAIAAYLIWIKSKTLLPAESQEEDEPDPETLEEMLLLRLQEYQRYKDAAVQLADRDLLGRDVFARNPPHDTESEGEGEQNFEEVSLFGLIEAFRTALERAETVADLHIIPERTRVEDKVDAMLKRLGGGVPLLFEDFFSDDADRSDVILTFISLLELVRLRAAHVRQSTPDAPILCTPTEAFTAQQLDYRALVLDGIFGYSASQGCPA